MNSPPSHEAVGGLRSFNEPVDRVGPRRGASERERGRRGDGVLMRPRRRENDHTSLSPRGLNIHGGVYHNGITRRYINDENMQVAVVEKACRRPPRASACGSTP